VLERMASGVMDEFCFVAVAAFLETVVFGLGK
jgi:hypothetical protein